ncbi:hypothetical protein Tco_1318195 [Tanacetum coccineum]
MLDPSQGFMDPWGKFGDLELPKCGTLPPKASCGERFASTHFENSRLHETILVLFLTNLRALYSWWAKKKRMSKILWHVRFAPMMVPGGGPLWQASLSQCSLFVLQSRVLIDVDRAESVSHDVGPKTAPMAKSLAIEISSNGKSSERWIGVFFIKEMGHWWDILSNPE